MLDWGDCGVGNPLLDLPAFFGPSRGSRDRIRGTGWMPGPPPCPAVTRRAGGLLAPVAAAARP